MEYHTTKHEFYKIYNQKQMNSPKIIAEIGCNHKGDMAIAKEMIMTAATYCKVEHCTLLE